MRQATARAWARAARSLELSWTTWSETELGIYGARSRRPCSTTPGETSQTSAAPRRAPEHSSRRSIFSPFSHTRRAPVLPVLPPTPSTPSLQIRVYPLHKMPYGDLPVDVDDGVMFCTYQSLISRNKQAESRLDQLVAWAAAATEDDDPASFDGVLVFDEAHRETPTLARSPSTPAPYTHARHGRAPSPRRRRRRQEPRPGEGLALRQRLEDRRGSHVDPAPAAQRAGAVRVGDRRRRDARPRLHVPARAVGRAVWRRFPRLPHVRIDHL